MNQNLPVSIDGTEQQKTISQLKNAANVEKLKKAKICKQCKLPKNNFRKGKCRSGYVYEFNYCADCQNENAKIKYWENPKKANDYNKKWREKNKEKYQRISKKSRRKYYLKNKERYIEETGKRQKKALEKLPDYYIKTRLKLSDAPKELIEAKRQQLELKRILRGRT